MKIIFFKYWLLVLFFFMGLLVFTANQNGKPNKNVDDRTEASANNILLSDSSTKWFSDNFDLSKPHLFLKINEDDCRMCIDSALENLFMFHDSILLANCHLLYARKDKKSFLSWRYYYNKKTTDAEINENILPVEIRSSPYSCFFALTTNHTITSIFYPKYDEANKIRAYLYLIKNNYFQNIKPQRF